MLANEGKFLPAISISAGLLRMPSPLPWRRLLMTTESRRFCDKCGAANRSTGKFCVACGEPLSIYASKATSVATDLLTNTTLLKQRYRIVRKIGEGGFSTVYLAEDIMFNAAPRVIKEMSIQVSGSQPLDPQEVQQSIEAFKQEAMLLASLTHPNLPRIYDHFEEQQRWYMVMDYIEGQTLEMMLQTAPAGKLELPLVLHIANQLCTVLNYLHTRQPPLIFRDLKPANIMITEDEHIYLIDFGIARLFKMGQAKDTVALGTPGYAAPEQFGRAQSTALTDIYGFGATLHHLLSGRDPSDEPFHFPPLTLDQYAAGPDLAALIKRMVAPQKEQRPASIQEIKQILQKLPSGNTSTIQVSQPNAPSPSSVKSVTVALSGADYSNLSSAIKHVPEKTRILVRPGTYTESIVLDKNIEIVGDGPREQIVLLSKNANCIRIATDSAAVSGMTIRGLAQNHFAIDIPLGRFHLSDCIVTCEAQTCIGIHNSTAQPSIQHCIIRDGGQSGILVYDQGAGVIENCEIFANKFAGVEVKTGGKPLIRQCKIHDGQHNDIFVHEQGEGTFEDCEIFANKFAGIEVKTGGKPLFRRCQIHDGEANGIFVHEQGEGAFEDCDIFANKLAGVLVKTGGKPLIYLCKIHDGQADGIVVHEQGEGTFEDCEIFANKFVGVEVEIGGKPLFRRCKIHDSQNGGIYVHDQGKGAFEDCDIFANKLAGILVKTGGNPLMRRCKIHDRQQVGIYVDERGKGIFEHCGTFANETYGLFIGKDADSVVWRGCRFRDGEKLAWRWKITRR
jgi:F-box protein 11